MHGTASPFAVASLSSKDLGHHPLGLSTFGNIVTMAAVSASNQIIRPECHANANARCLLTDVRMHRTFHLTSLEKVHGSELKLPDPCHPAVHLEQRLLFDSHVSLASLRKPR
jgi:hypothetical protein